MVEHVIGNDGVSSSILLGGTSKTSYLRISCSPSNLFGEHLGSKLVETLEARRIDAWRLKWFGGKPRGTRAANVSRRLGLARTPSGALPQHAEYIFPVAERCHRAAVCRSAISLVLRTLRWLGPVVSNTNPGSTGPLYQAASASKRCNSQDTGEAWVSPHSSGVVRRSLRLHIVRVQKMTNAMTRADCRGRMESIPRSARRRAVPGY